MQLESLQVGVLSTRTLRQAQACLHGNSPESGYIFKNIIGLQLKLSVNASEETWVPSRFFLPQ
ncbi:hypothetical protein DAPPUDRAFT_331067 [Daphnia pulex]|uniref:Uncharacterized protein n=1 Tax=Daphnia pulex TaxID=6669 RepID=E9HLE3_DAPPU|nr:hypothetical protein DAPPUDRAFT_331067 [Daphnia pulex]|eukprot:EFX67421.1 hypothetical protein DAPPUDRAFT_331067 [Daphnia pulex]